jgi:hypothetical protein
MFIAEVEHIIALNRRFIQKKVLEEVENKIRPGTQRSSWDHTRFHDKTFFKRGPKTDQKSSKGSSGAGIQLPLHSVDSSTASNVVTPPPSTDGSMVNIPTDDDSTTTGATVQAQL